MCNILEQRMYRAEYFSFKFQRKWEGKSQTETSFFFSSKQKLIETKRNNYDINNVDEARTKLASVMLAYIKIYLPYIFVERRMIFAFNKFFVVLSVLLQLWYESKCISTTRTGHNYTILIFSCPCFKCFHPQHLMGWLEVRRSRKSIFWVKNSDNILRWLGMAGFYKNTNIRLAMIDPIT